MNNPTRAQIIIEGRDEALEHMGIDPAVWERLAHDTRRKRVIWEAAKSTDGKAAAGTVALAEWRLTDSLIGASKWHWTWIAILAVEPRHQSNHTLQA